MGRTGRLKSRSLKAHGKRALARKGRTAGEIRSDVGCVPTPDETEAADSTDTEVLDPVRRENRQLRILNEAIHFLGTAESVERLAPEVVSLGLSLAGLSRGLLALRSGRSSAGEPLYRVRIVRGIGRGERSSPEIRVLRAALARALETRQALFEADARFSDVAAAEPCARRLALGALVALPLDSKDELLGALVLESPSRRKAFLQQDMDLLLRFARHAGLALASLAEKRRLARRSERLRAESDSLRRRLEETQRELDALKARGTTRSTSGRLAASSSGRLF